MVPNINSALIVFGSKLNIGIIELKQLKIVKNI